MKIKVTIQIDEDSFEFGRAVWIRRAVLSEMLPDWADLFLTRR